MSDHDPTEQERRTTITRRCWIAVFALFGLVIVMVVNHAGGLIDINHPRWFDPMRPLNKIMGFLPFGTEGRITVCGTNEQFYRKAQSMVLSNHILDTYPDAKVLLIIDTPNDFNTIRHEAILPPLTRLNIVATWSRSVQLYGDPMNDDLSDNWAADFDQAITDHPEADVVLSINGLPPDYQQLTLWDKEAWELAHPGRKRPVLALLKAYTYDLKPQFHAGVIGAAVSYSSESTYDPERPLPISLFAAFDERYILITPKNVDEMAAKHHGLFAEDAP